MYSYTIVQWIFFFYFYCFFGWCFESTYVSLKKKKWVNRGFVRGPFLPLYGCGAIMMLVVSQPFQDSLILTYAAGCLGATALEYVTGVVMESLFKVRYWDYSKQKFNFQGHICLGSSLAWGGLTILMTHVVHRPIESLVLSVPGSILTAATFLITVVFAGDFAVSFKAALDLRDVLVKMEQAREELERMQKRLDVVIAVANDAVNNVKKESQERLEDIQEELQDWLEEYQDSRRERLDERRMQWDELTGRIEERLHQARELLLISDVLNDRKEELFELGGKFRLYLERHEKTLFLKDMVRRGMLKGNPGMVSKKFREALEELKDALDEKK